MSKDYMFECRGCNKADKTYWYNDEENPESDGEQYSHGYPTSKHHHWARQDAYGIYTGLYCTKCYHNPEIYTYHKHEYFDEAYAGERMEEDY
tara:strand:+ start:2830 stop:3105 length:276 start_codon:yes stop_codon:yes gene_type:complete